MKFKPFDKVLVRDGNVYEWQPELFYKINEEGKYCTLGDVEWSQCIPYEGNEHLLNTADMPEIIDLKNNILFGIELKVGYVLEFDNFSHNAAIIVPTTKGLGVTYLDGNWDYLVNIYPDKVKSIKGIIDDNSFTGGNLLWSK